MKEIEKSFYERYVSDQREAEASEDRQNLVKKILEQLPESERTVITLYYLGEMTTQEIGKLLGVSVHTITSRLQRARKRLQENEERILQEVFSGVQISESLTQNVMRRVADMSPTPPPTVKPLLPWAALGTAVVFVALLLGTSNQYLRRFQEPYSFEVQSDPLIKIIDAPVVLDLDAKQAVRNQDGEAALPNESRGVGLQTSENVLARDTQARPFSSSTSPWTQASGPQGIPSFNEEPLSTELMAAIAEAERIDLNDDIKGNARLAKLLHHIVALAKASGFAVSGETFYVEHKRMLFKWKPGETQWTHTGLIDLGKQSTEDLRDEFKVAASGEIVYVGKRDGKLSQSLDAGRGWKDITATLPLRFTRFNEIRFVGSTFYVATDAGVLSSQTGEYWRVLTDGTGTQVIIDRLAVDRTTVYGVGDTGVYHLNILGHWQQIFPNIPDEILALAVSNSRLYIATRRRGVFHSLLKKEQDHEPSHK